MEVTIELNRACDFWVEVEGDEVHIAMEDGHVRCTPFQAYEMSDALRAVAGAMTYHHVHHREFKTVIRSCSRCGLDHGDVDVKMLAGELPFPYTHFAMCPETGHPLFIRILQVEEEQ